jgi:hypothetical protein
MQPINGNNKSPLQYEYKGIKGGKDFENHDDILTKKLEKKEGQMVGVFIRVHNKTLWQKIRNQLFSSPVNKRDAAAFLIDKGMNSGAAKTRINEIAYSSHEIPAKAFEEALATLPLKK